MSVTKQMSDQARLTELYNNALNDLKLRSIHGSASCVEFLDGLRAANLNATEATFELSSEFVSFVNARAHGARFEELYNMTAAIKLFSRYLGKEARELAVPARALVEAMQPFFKSKLQSLQHLSIIFDTLYPLVWKTSADYHEGSIYVRNKLIQPFSGYMQLTTTTRKITRTIGSPIKIAFFPRSLGLELGYAPASLQRSWWSGLEQLGPRVAEIHIYTGSSPDKEVEQYFNSCHNIKMRNWASFLTESNGDYNKTLEYVTNQLRASLAKDAIDVIVFDEVSSTYLQLIHRRIAPIQLFCPMSFVPLIFSGVDGFFLCSNTHDDALGMGISGDQIVRVPFSAAPEFLTPDRNEEALEVARAMLPSGRLVLGTFARQQKMSLAFAKVVAKLLIRVPDSIFFVAGIRNPELVKQLFIDAGCDVTRIAVLGSVDAHTYGYLIDVYLETFPIAQGLAAVEIMAKGVPVVHLKSPGLESIWKTQRDPRAVANDVDEYLEIAARLCNNAAIRAEYGEAGLSIVEPIMDIEANAATLVKEVSQFVRTHQRSK